jgi:hypothetical protein
MAITNGYATLVEFKSRYYPAGLVDTSEDSMIESIVEGVSRWIDKHCGRHFYLASGVTRYYTALDGDYLQVDDLLVVTTLKTDEDGDRTYERTWASTDYDLHPYNAAVASQEQPYTWIETAPNGRYAFPTGRKGVQIVGNWGYASAVPPMIKEACLLQSGRIFNRRNAPFGVAGSAEMGQLLVMPKFDPDVALLLQPYLRMLVGSL